MREEEKLLRPAVEERLEVLLHGPRLGARARPVQLRHEPLLLHAPPARTAAAAAAEVERLPRVERLPQRLELFLYGANFVERVTLREREYHLLALFRRELREDVLLESADHHQPRDDGEEFVGVDASLPPESRARTVPLRELGEFGEDVRAERLHLRVELDGATQRRGSGETDGAARRLEQRRDGFGALRFRVLEKMGLVAHDDLVRATGELLRHLPDETVRDDGHLGGVDLVRLPAGAHGGDGVRGDVQPTTQRRLPRAAKRRGDEDERGPLVAITRHQRQRLHRLPETHLIADEHTTAARETETNTLALERKHSLAERRGDARVPVLHQRRHRRSRSRVTVRVAGGRSIPPRPQRPRPRPRGFGRLGALGECDGGGALELRHGGERALRDGVRRDEIDDDASRGFELPRGGGERPVGEGPSALAAVEGGAGDAATRGDERLVVHSGGQHDGDATARLLERELHANASGRGGRRASLDAIVVGDVDPDRGGGRARSEGERGGGVRRGRGARCGRRGRGVGTARVGGGGAEVQRGATAGRGDRGRAVPTGGRRVMRVSRERRGRGAAGRARGRGTRRGRRARRRKVTRTRGRGIERRPKRRVVEVVLHVEGHLAKISRGGA